MEAFLVSGSAEERKKYIGDLIGSSTCRIVLCSVQFTDDAIETFRYFWQRRFRMHVWCLNPGHGDLTAVDDTNGLIDTLLRHGASVSIRNGHESSSVKAQEIRECIYGWAVFRNLLIRF